MMQEARSAAASRIKASLPAVKPTGHQSTGPAFQQYQAAVQLLQQAKYDKALAAFEKLLPSAPPEILERCKMYISTCRRQLERPNLAFQTPEERYDYAVSQLNTGFYDEAREQFNGVITDDPSADYAYYGLAVLDSITGRSKDCLTNLAKAIELNPHKPPQARSDNDSKAWWTIHALPSCCIPKFRKTPSHERSLYADAESRQLALSAKILKCAFCNRSE